MAVGNLDNNGNDDLILYLPGYGIWSWRNHPTGSNCMRPKR